jgi:L-arabinokinase
VSRTAFFYVSGHGFGHAIRQIEIMSALAARLPDVRIFVRTTAPAWLFERTARFAYTLLPGETDTGVLQRDSLSLDEAETIRMANAFYGQLDARAKNEAALLTRHAAGLVIADAPPLACAAASAAGIPSFVCANFTWDWIYAGYSPPPVLIDTIEQAYRLAAAGWRMPMHGGFHTIHPIVDLPFVARHARSDSSREDARRTLGLSSNRRLALISFGGYGVEGLRLDGLDSGAEWQMVMTGRNLGMQPDLNDAVIELDETAIYAAGLRYEDLVCAVDVVITKPGYGIISDCIANDTAMLYTSRGRFAEYDVLVSEMPRYLRCRFIEMDDLREGRWRESLDAVMNAPEAPEKPRTDGAAVVAEMICDVISRS